MEFLINFFNLIRAKHFIKNFLIFLPLIIANAYTKELLGNALIAFLIFCLVTATIYVFNDIADFSKDRLDPNKKDRLIASGRININKAKIILIALFLISLFLAFKQKYFHLIIVYFFFNIIYTLYFKSIRYLDICFLVFFFIIRIYIGGYSTNINISNHLLIFSICSFGYLAISKRLNILIKYRGKFLIYKTSDVKILKNLSITFLISSNLYFIYYLLNYEAINPYSSPIILFLLFPIYLYLSSDFVKLSFVGKLKSDPIEHILSGKKYISLIIFTFVIIFLSQYIKI